MLKAQTAIIFSMLILPAATLYGAIYEMEGQVTSGFSLFPPVEQDLTIPSGEFGIPAGGFPVDFKARLELGVEPTDWSFEFEVTDDERSVQYVVGGPRQTNNNHRFDKNNVTLLLGEVSIDFFKWASFSEGFNLLLDTDAGTGQWAWFEDCPVCDLIYLLPAATANVSSIRVVPEPSSVMIWWLVGVISLATSRRR